MPSIEEIIAQYRKELSKQPISIKEYVEQIETYLKSDSHKPLDLSGLSLNEINLSGANLKDCNFSRCNLNDANFNHAIIEDCDFSHSSLYYAKFNNVTINQNTNFLDAYAACCHIDDDIISKSKSNPKFDNADGHIREVHNLTPVFRKT